MIYFSSDWHFYHKNILKYDNRPFSTMDEMIEHIITRTNDIVKEDDELYFLWDLNFSHNDETLNRLCKINCKNMYWVRGNHDSDSAVNKMGRRFKWVKNEHVLEIEWRKIRLEHYPPIDYTDDGNGGMKKVSRYTPSDYDICIHWHTHKPLYYDNCADVSYDGGKLIYDLQEIIWKLWK